MCLQVNPRNQDISEEEIEVADTAFIDIDDEDEIEADDDGLEPDMISVILVHNMTFYHTDTERGLASVNMALGFLGEETVVEEHWNQLTSIQKKEVFEMLIKVDYVKESEEESISDARVKAVAAISSIICGQSKDSMKIEMEETRQEAKKLVEDDVVADNAEMKIVMLEHQETGRGLIWVNKALDFWGQERVLEEKWDQLSSSQKIEVFDIFINLDTANGVEEKSSARDNSFAALTSIVDGHSKVD